jgi:hypothetical protein
MLVEVVNIKYPCGSKDIKKILFSFLPKLRARITKLIFHENFATLY